MTAEHAGQAGAHAFVAIRREHLAGVIELFREERWPAFADDPEATWRAMTAPGVTTMVAVDGERVVGVAQMLSDGQIQAHLSVIVVAEGYRRRGIGSRLIREAFARCGAQRVDLSTDGPSAFYESFPHRRLTSYRIYPAGPPSKPGQ